MFVSIRERLTLKDKNGMMAVLIPVYVWMQTLEDTLVLTSMFLLSITIYQVIKNVNNIVYIYFEIYQCNCNILNT